MNRRRFTLNLAQSITRGEWSKEFIETNLLRRLPPALHKLVPSIAKDLIAEFPGRYSPNPTQVSDRLVYIPTFERIYRYCARKQIWPDPDLSPPAMAPIPAFQHLELPELPTISALSEFLFLTPEKLDYLADRTGRYEEHGDMAVNHYHYILKAKRTSGVRLIEAPKQTLKAIQRQVLHSIVDKLPTHPNAFGFVKKRNCLQSANRHVGEEVVIRFDLKNFFPSISAGRIFGVFRCLGYPQDVARYLTALSTTQTPSRILERLEFPDRGIYKTPHLPQGSPLSPALANQAAFGLDRRLSALANRLDANYSRYADDLAFSGDHAITRDLLRLVPQIVQEEGFVLNRAKTRVMPQSTRQTVTGIVVNDHLNIDRKTFDTLKAVIHACQNPDDTRLTDPAFRASLEGKITWVETVNPARGQKLWRLLAKAAEARFQTAQPR